MADFSVVCGVDKKHLRQLSWVFPTWRKHKPALMDVPWVIFFDREEVRESEVRAAIQYHPATMVPWPLEKNTVYEGDPKTKFFHPQRYKMLSGFIHVPARAVQTTYWLKLDTDVVAVGTPEWIDKKWFKDTPAIVSPSWSFTKPPDQMVKLDEWVRVHRHKLTVLNRHEPLDLIPKEGADRLGHKRIISWCGFFLTSITRFAADCAAQTCGQCKLPVPSQDGYIWYVAKRLEQEIKTVSMKTLGWEWWGTERNVRNAVQRALSSE